MSDFRRRLLMIQVGEGELPTNLKKVNWIENPSDAYIDTGILSQSGLDIEIKFENTGITHTQFSPIIGARNKVEGRLGRLVFQKSLSDFLFGYLDNQKYGTFINDPKLMLFKSKSNNASVQQGSRNIDLSVAAANFKGTQTLYLFANNVEGHPNSIYCNSIRMYYCKISKDGTELRNFIPCRDANTLEVGMYDLVEGKFYKSVSGTNFKCNEEGGEVVPPKDEVTFVNYIENPSNAYINTNYKPATATFIELEFDCTPQPKSSESTVFGSYKDYGSSIQIDLSIDANDVYTLLTGKAGQSSKYSDWILKGANKCDINNSKFSLNNKDYKFASVGNVETNLPIYLFCNNNNNKAQNFAKIKLKSCKISELSNLIKDFVPAKDINGDYGLFDKVEKKFYKSASGTKFIGG